MGGSLWDEIITCGASTGMLRSWTSPWFLMPDILLQGGRPVFDPWGWEDPLKEGMAIHSTILAWRIPKDGGAWWAIVHGVAKSWT